MNSIITKLPNDVARCATGLNCWQRYECARYVCRNTGQERVVYFSPDVPKQDQKCEYLIPIHTNEKIKL